MTKNQRRAARLAARLGYRIWQSVKQRGYSLPVPKRTPKLVKKYLRHILKANKINWTVKNPPYRRFRLYVHGRKKRIITTTYNAKSAKRIFAKAENIPESWVTVKRVR